MVHFVGAGPGAEDLITVRGQRFLKEADVVIYAGSLVNKELLKLCKNGTEFYDSANLTLEKVIGIIRDADNRGLDTVRLHSGDPSVYGAIREQIDELCKLSIGYDITPGVTAAMAAAAELGIEFTLPEVSQTFVITRISGRTKVPENEKIEEYAASGASIAIYLSTGLLDELKDRLVKVIPSSTPAALVYKVSRPEQIKIVSTIGELPHLARKEGINNTAVILLGKAIGQSGYQRSKLYDPDFETGFRKSEK